MMRNSYTALVKNRLQGARETRMTVRECVQQAAAIRVSLRTAIEHETINPTTAMVMLMQSNVWMDVATALQRSFEIAASKASEREAEHDTVDPDQVRCRSCGQIWNASCIECRNRHLGIKERREGGPCLARR